MADWKERRKKLLEKVDSGLQKYVADPAERVGIGPVGAAIAAGASATADLVTPEDTTDVALMVAGGPAVKLIKKLSRMKKAKRAAGAVDSSAEAPQKMSKAWEPEELAKYKEKNPIGFAQMDELNAKDFAKGKRSKEEYERKKKALDAAAALTKKDK